MRWSAALALVPFLLAIVVIDVSSMARTSATYDEWAHVDFGKSVLERVPGRLPEQKMAVSLLHYLPLYWTGGRSLFLARLPSVLASLVLASLVFWWARRLYGLRGALLSATLYTLCPTVIAHSRLATNDVACACLTFAATMLFVRYLKAPTLGRLIACAVVTGLAQITKHTALLLGPIFAVLWVIDAVGDVRPRVRRLLAHAALAVVVIAVVVNAGYLFDRTLLPLQAYLAHYRSLDPAFQGERGLAGLASLASRLPDLPVPLPYAYVYALTTGMLYNATGGGHGPIYLLGELSRTGWWYYFLVAFGLKTPLGVMLILLAAAVLSPPWFRKHPLDESALLIAALVVFAFFSFACTAQLGIRYVLPALPFLFVAAGKVAAFTPRRHAAAYRAALVGLVSWAAVSSLSFHPHYLAYVNELIGDRTNMWRYLADSNVDWGQSKGDLARYLAAEGRGRVAVNPDAPVTGRVVVNVNALVGVTEPREKYAWLREGFRPVGHVGYGHLVYEVPER